MPETAATATAHSSAEASAAATRRRRETPGLATERTARVCRSGVGGPIEKASIAIPSGSAGVVRGICRIGSSSRPVKPVVSPIDKTGSMVGGCVECGQTIIERGRGSSDGPAGFRDDYAASVIRVIEIRIKTAIPHEITIPAEIGIPETHADAHPRISVHSISKAKRRITVSEGIRRIAKGIIWACRHWSGSIIIVVIVVIVKTGPTRIIRRFHSHIIIAGRRAVIVALPRAGCRLGRSRRIAGIIGILRSLAR